MATTTAPVLTVEQIAAALAAMTPDQRKAVRSAATKASADPRPCGCGCGATTASRFAIGHDAKLKSRLILAFRAGQPLPAPVPAGPPAETDPARIASALGWSQFLTPAKVKAPKAPKAEAAPKSKVAQAPVRETPAAKAAKAQAEIDGAKLAKAEAKGK